MAKGARQPERQPAAREHARDGAVASGGAAEGAQQQGRRTPDSRGHGEERVEGGSDEERSTMREEGRRGQQEGDAGWGLGIDTRFRFGVSVCAVCRVRE